MFDLFTDRAKEAMGSARREALNCGHHYIGAEHILIGLIREGVGTGYEVLRSLDVDLKELLRDIQVPTGQTGAALSQDRLPFTKAAKSVLHCGHNAGRFFGHNHIGTEHLLMGLLLTDGTLASEALQAMNVQIEDVRAQVLEAVGLRILAGAKHVRLLGFDDETMPRLAADEVRAVLAAKGLEPAISPRAALVVAFAPERDPTRMFEIGFACGVGRPVIVLLLPGESIDLKGALSMEIDDALPAQMERVIRRDS